MLIGLQDWIHLLVLPFARTKREEELEMVKTVESKKFIDGTARVRMNS